MTLEAVLAKIVMDSGGLHMEDRKEIECLFYKKDQRYDLFVKPFG